MIINSVEGEMLLLSFYFAIITVRVPNQNFPEFICWISIYSTYVF